MYPPQHNRNGLANSWDDYEIPYKKGKDNIVADSLSRTFDDQGSLSVISMPVPSWLQSVQQGYVNDSSLSQIINAWTKTLLLSHITLGMVLH